MVNEAPEVLITEFSVVTGEENELMPCNINILTGGAASGPGPSGDEILFHLLEQSLCLMLRAPKMVFYSQNDFRVLVFRYVTTRGHHVGHAAFTAVGTGRIVVARPTSIGQEKTAFRGSNTISEFHDHHHSMSSSS